uniref:Endo/exonuclease/phosphatase domain-containing protein n=1 Tax=Strongyloides stercoralis TaxID=6248 RepID=A0A0K0DZ07_STRER
MEKHSSEKENIPPGEGTSPDRRTSPGGDGKHYKGKFCSDPSRRRPNMRSGRIEVENRDRKEDSSGRKRRSDRIDSGNLVGKRSTRDGNYYGEKSLRSKPSYHNPDERLRKNEKKKWDYNENKSSRRRRESSGTDYSKSPVREKPSPKIDGYYQELLFRSRSLRFTIDPFSGGNEKKSRDHNEYKTRSRKESSGTDYSESPVRGGSSIEDDNYSRGGSFCSKSSRHSSDKCLRGNEKKNRDYNENKTSRRRRGFGAIDYKNPVSKESSTRDDNYYGEKSFCSKSSHRKSDKCFGKNEKKNRNYDENKTSRGSGFGTIDSGNPVKKGSSTKKGNYYGKKLPRSDSSFHKSDKCLKRDEEKNENHKEDARDDCGQSYKDITGEERRSDSNDSGSSVNEKGISESDGLHRNKKDTKNDDNCQYKDENPVERRSFTQDENYDRERSPYSHQLPHNSDNHKNYEEKDARNDCCQQSGDEVGKEKHSDNSNFNSPVEKIIPLQSTGSSIEKAGEESRDEDQSISILTKPATSSPQEEKTIVLSSKGIEYSTSNDTKKKKTTSFLDYLRKKTNEKLNSKKENTLKIVDNSQLSPVLEDTQSTFSEINDNIQNYIHGGFSPYSRGSSENGEIMKGHDSIARSYTYEIFKNNDPVSYEDVLNYNNMKSPNYEELINDVVYDPLTESTVMRGIVLRSFEQVNNPLNDHNSCIFTLKSHNLLSQREVLKHLERYTHLTVTKDDGSVELHRVLSQFDRYGRLLYELGTFWADIMCLQGCDELLYENFLRPELGRHGFKGEFRRNTFPVHGDGCATFYSNKFKLVNKKDVGFLELLEPDDIVPHSAQILEFELNSDDFGPLGEKTHLFVANTHIVFNTDREDLKVLQVAYLLSKLQEMISKCDSPYAYIMCGDFNIQPHSKMYNFILGDQSEYIFNKTTSSEKTSTKSIKTSTSSNNNSKRKPIIDIDYIFRNEKKEGDYRNNFIHRLPFASAYDHYTGEPREPEISTYNTGGASNPDYIFYGVANTSISGDMVSVNETSTLSLLGRLTLPSASEIAQNLGPLPNSITGSDHLPLLTYFQLR